MDLKFLERSPLVAFQCGLDGVGYIYGSGGRADMPPIIGKYRVTDGVGMYDRAGEEEINNYLEIVKQRYMAFVTWNMSCIDSNTVRSDRF